MPTTGVGTPSMQDGAADDGWIRAEAPHPEAMRQHGNVRRTRCALGLGEPSAERGRDAQHRRQGRRCTRDHDTLRRAAARQCAADPVVAGDAVERAGILRELVVQLPTHDLHTRGNVAARDAVIEHDQPIGVRIGQRVEDDAVDEREDGGIGRDRQRQRGRGGGGEYRRARHSPRGVTQFLCDRVHDSCFRCRQQPLARASHAGDATPSFRERERDEACALAPPHLRCAPMPHRARRGESARHRFFHGRAVLAAQRLGTQPHEPAVDTHVTLDADTAHAAARRGRAPPGVPLPARRRGGQVC